MLAVKIAFVPFFVLCVGLLLVCLHQLGAFNWRKK